MIVDDEELYEREKPLPLDDIRCLIIILREVLLLSIISFLCTCSLDLCLYASFFIGFLSPISNNH